jgi:glycosyltransferase involved in cell wall biosynthesis
MKVLLEMRPALDGHAGIPQETRLLFRGLHKVPGIAPIGLIQSHGNVLQRGLPADRERLARVPQHKRLDRLSRVVISLQQRVGNAYVAGAQMMARQLIGQSEKLDRFEPAFFQDFVWRAMFDRTLHADDLETVTRAEFRSLSVPWRVMHVGAMVTRAFGMPIYPRLDTRGIDVMIAETPYPGRVAVGTTLVVRYHDAIPVLMPHTISDKARHQARHLGALQRNVKDGAWFTCVSDATRSDLLSLFPQAEQRAVTIPNMISTHYWREESDPQLIPDILHNRANAEVGRGPLSQDGAPLRYLLMVSTIEPRKNHLTFLSAWERLRATACPQLKLVLVGALGWHYKEIVKRFLPWIQRGELFLLEDVPSNELRHLYRHAAATVCPSVGEGFDFSGVEAMRCGSPVVASDLGVHREIFGDAAEYFSPYDGPAAAASILRVILEEGRQLREELVRRGERRAARYTPDAILPLWQEFLCQRLPAVGK